MSEQTINLPKHVGYIVDGNRRWAKKHGLPAYEGHLAGYNAIQDVARATFDSGVEYMSAYIFSTENWKRSENEVKALMGLVLKLFASDLHIFNEENIVTDKPQHIACSGVKFTGYGSNNESGCYVYRLTAGNHLRCKN